MDSDEIWWTGLVCDKDEFDFGEDPDMIIFFLLLCAREVKSVVKQLDHLSLYVCLSVYKRQFIIEEKLNFN